MTLSRFAYSRPKRQEHFSEAYVQAIAATAGYCVEDVKIDEDSTDVFIAQRSNVEDPNDYPYYSRLKIQLKCTYAHKSEQDGCIHYPLTIKNYDDLRRENTGEPFILVVVCIPDKNEASWLEDDDDSMLLYNTAHWMSLRGYPPSGNDDTQTVLIPEAQRFNVDSLHNIMEQLARGEMPC